MQRSRVAVVALIYVLISRISGAEVEMRVRPGDDVTLYCDRSWTAAVKKVWFRNSSNEHRPPLIISEDDVKNGTFPRYSFVRNPYIKTYDLLVKKVTESDLGLYYCGGHEKQYILKTGALMDVYYLGYRMTRLSFCDPAAPAADPPETPDCSVCWKLLVSVCPVCVLLSSVVSSTCVYCICRNKIECAKERRELLTDNVFQVGCAEEHQCERSMKGEFCFHTEVCYTSLKSELKSE